MSADKGIYILPTLDHGCETWRVAHAQAIDDFWFYLDTNAEQFKAYLVTIWGNSEVFYTKDAAKIFASHLALGYDELEYGISEIDTEPLEFPSISQEEARAILDMPIEQPD